MIYIHDTRDKPGKHDNVEKYLTAHGHKIVRSKLYCGDISLLNDQSVCIDLKQGLQEVYGNVIQDHERFKAEAVRARAAGIRLIVLVEEPGIASIYDVPNWNNPRLARWKAISEAHKQGKRLNVKISAFPPAPSHKLGMIMHALSRKYGIEWQFCSKDQTGQRIIALLGGNT